MLATLTDKEILRRLVVCGLRFHFAPFPFSAILVFNGKSPMFPGFCSRTTEKKIHINVSKTVFMPICSIIYRLRMNDVSFLLYCKNPTDNSETMTI